MDGGGDPGDTVDEIGDDLVEGWQIAKSVLIFLGIPLVASEGRG